MKDFIKMTLAVICGTILTGIIFFIISMGIVGAVASGSDKTPVIPSSGVLKIDMSKLVITEQSKESDPIASLKGQGDLIQLGIWDAIQAINMAAEDPAVQFIYLKTDGSSSSVTACEEFRKALSNFRNTSNKAIVSYIESPTTGSYYLASVADKVYMTSHPGATTMVTGVSSTMIFLGDLLDKLGVNVQLIRHGKYKSAGEMYTRGSASPENKEQYQAMVNSIWNNMATAIAESRSISVNELNAAVDELKLNLPQDYLDCKLVDGLMTRTELEQKLADLAVVEDYKHVTMIDFTDYATAKLTPSKAKEKIAVIYADGQIVDGSAETEVTGERFASIIERVRQDASVKAVVLRVNSPGGSVLASEKIKHELDLLKEEKPLVASYGDYAASGGYWISNNCEKIFTDATTLTGSIGVFGMVPNLGKVAKNTLHVGVESINSNKHGDMYSLMRPLSTDEQAYMQRSIEDIYTRFTTIVAEARGMEVSQVDAIAQGRVWTGEDALGIGLVDEIGTIEDAIRYAAAAAGNEDLNAWNIKGYPAPPTLLENIMNSINGKSEDYSVLINEFSKLKSARIEARLPYEITICR